MSRYGYSKPIASDYVESAANEFVSEIYSQIDEDVTPKLIEVVGHLSTIAVGSFRHARTVAAILRRMSELLPFESEEYTQLRVEAMDVAFATFINCWRREFSGHFRNLSLPRPSSPTSTLEDEDDDAEPFLKAADPHSVAAYLGELYAAEILPAGCLEYGIQYIATQLTDAFHLECLELLISRAYSQAAPALKPSFLLDMLSEIRQSCERSPELKNAYTEEKKICRFFYKLIDKAAPLHDKAVLIEHRIAMFIRRHRSPAWKRRSVSETSSSGSTTAVNTASSSPVFSSVAGSPASFTIPLEAEAIHPF